MSASIEQVIRAVFKAETGALTQQLAVLDGKLSAVEDRALAVNAAITGSVAPKATIGASPVNAQIIKSQIDADTLKATLADDLPAASHKAAAGAEAVAKSSVKAGGGLGKMWQSAKMLTNILPGLGMAGAVGGIVTAIDALFSLLDGGEGKMSKFGADAANAAISVGRLAGTLGDLNKKIASTFVDLSKSKVSRLAIEAANALARGDEAGAARLTREGAIEAARHDVTAQTDKVRQMEEANFRLREREASDKNSAAALDMAIGRLQSSLSGKALTSGFFDQTSFDPNNPEDVKALAGKLGDDGFTRVGPVPGVEMDAQALLDAIDKKNQMVREDAMRQVEKGLFPSQSEEAKKTLDALKAHLEDVSRPVGDIRLGEEFVLPELAKGGFNLNVANAKFTINQRVTTNDPGELAGAALVAGFRSLTNRVIRPEGMTAPTGRP